MARIPTIKRFSVEDFKDQSTWIGKLFDPLNSFLVTVTSALTNQLTHFENLNAQLINIQIQTKKDLVAGPTVGGNQMPFYAALFNAPSFQTNLKTKPLGVTLWSITNANGRIIDTAGNPALKYGVSVFWTYSEGQIQINHVSGLEADTTYNLTLLVSGG